VVKNLIKLGEKSAHGESVMFGPKWNRRLTRVSGENRDLGWLTVSQGGQELSHWNLELSGWTKGFHSKYGTRRDKALWFFGYCSDLC
jgi:hypothetical protein